MTSEYDVNNNKFSTNHPLWKVETSPHKLYYLGTVLTRYKLWYVFVSIESVCLSDKVYRLGQ